MEKQVLTMPLTPIFDEPAAPTPIRVWLAVLLTTVAILAGCATPGSHDGQGPVVEAPAAREQPIPATTSTTAVTPVTGEHAAKAAVAAPIDPLQPERPVDVYEDEEATDLWARLRSGFAMPDLDTDLVHDREDYYASRPDYMDRMTERGGRYLFHILEEIDKRGMPTELALLPFVESAFNPQAMSSAKASGMWQFIPDTGRHYQLTQNMFRDDRRDVLASTRAALDYLARLYGMFGDWQLALAGYNWGEGNVQRAIARNERAGLPTDYEHLRMPAETRLYVPKLQAIKNIVADPEKFGIDLPELKNHPYFLSVPIERDIDVDIAARMAGISLEEFKQLNPQMNKPVILAAGTEQLLLPYDNANRFVRNLMQAKGPTATWTAWVVPRTMTAAEAAKEVEMSEQELREVNRIPARMRVKQGSTLLVQRDASVREDVSANLADNAIMELAPDVAAARRVTVRVGRKGDSVAGVARRYRVSTSDVAMWNKVSTKATFRRGARVVLYLPKKSSTAVTRTARKSAAKHTASGSKVKAGAATRTATKKSSRSTTASKSGSAKQASRSGGKISSKTAVADKR